MTDRQLRTYCSLCGVGCPVLVTVDDDRVVGLDADRTHPRGGILCTKGRAAPEIHDHPHRINYPLVRTRPKSESDPGWQRCSWDRALDLVGTTLRRIRTESGAEAVAFGRGTASGTGLGPVEPWVKRLANAFGSPNYLTNTHVCNWARDGAADYTFGVYPLPPPEVQHSGCIVVWGANPSATALDLASSITTACQRGARLVVVDPRKVGLGSRADELLQLRPGTDAALALAIIWELIENRWFDERFVRQWTNAPYLVRDDTVELLHGRDLAPDQLDAAGPGFVAVTTTRQLVEFEPAQPPGPDLARALALRGSVSVTLRTGEQVACRPVFELLAERAEQYRAEAAAEITGVPVPQIRAAARLMAEHRPVSVHTWNGIVQHTNATQAGRAIAVLFALLGDWDRAGGNVVPPARRTAAVDGATPLPAQRTARRLGRQDRPLGPAAANPGHIASNDLFTAICDAQPYPIRALVSFGGNTLLNSADPVQGRRALQQLEFFVQAELFHTPTSQFADVLLPATSFLENDVLMISRAGRAERRRRTVAPRYERRSDIEIIFQLAHRLGLDDAFAGGSIERAYDDILAPAGLSWAGLLDHPDGVPITDDVQYEKYTTLDAAGQTRGFGTPSGKVELFVERFAEQGQPPLPDHTEPAESPVGTPELAHDYPLVLTNAKRPRYLHSQHRGVAGLRRNDPDPLVEVHPETAAAFGVVDGSWVLIETARSRVRAKADVTPRIAPGVVCANHGWWEACDELGRSGLDPFEESGANVNLLVSSDVRDPVSGALPFRSTLCRLRPLL